MSNLNRPNQRILDHRNALGFSQQILRQHPDLWTDFNRWTSKTIQNGPTRDTDLTQQKPTK